MNIENCPKPYVETFLIASFNTSVLEVPLPTVGAVAYSNSNDGVLKHTEAFDRSKI